MRKVNDDFFFQLLRRWLTIRAIVSSEEESYALYIEKIVSVNYKFIAEYDGFLYTDEELFSSAVVKGLHRRGARFFLNCQWQ